jgi:uncharacterized protein
VITSLKALRSSATVAHVGPLVLFMGLSSLVPWFKTANSALPWYQAAPEHWLYPLQCLIVGAFLWMCRAHYRLAPWRGLPLAALFAVVGIGCWVLPAELWLSWQTASPPAWWEWLGIAERKDGFDPSIFTGSAFTLTVGLRLLRMVVIVPLVEELFWRGFLTRYVQAGEKEFTRVPFGKHSWLAFWIVTLAVTAIHQQVDWLAAFIWGSLMYLLCTSTKSLGACLIMHGIGNLLLGLYVLKTQQWGFW